MCFNGEDEYSFKEYKLITEKWKKVPSLFGQNTIYNSLALADRNIYSVQSRNNDQISITFSGSALLTTLGAVSSTTTLSVVETV